jgi:hypothetical protein
VVKQHQELTSPIGTTGMSDVLARLERIEAFISQTNATAAGPDTPTDGSISSVGNNPITGNGHSSRSPSLVGSSSMIGNGHASGNPYAHSHATNPESRTQSEVTDDGAIRGDSGKLVAMSTSDDILVSQYIT